MVVIGYYTTDPVYSECYELLKASMDRFGMKYDFEAIDPGEWKYITDLKPRIVLGMLEKYKQPILYLDVDAFVHEDLEPFFGGLNSDIAVHYLTKKSGEEELLSGTVYFDYNEKVISLVNAWLDAEKNNPTLNDQQSLQLAISEFNSDLNLYQLPAAYTYIFDRKYSEVERPIIEHLQASREIYCRRDMNTIKNRFKSLIGLSNNREKLLNRRHTRLVELKELLARLAEK